VRRLPTGQHLDEPADALRSRLGALGVADAVEDGERLTPLSVLKNAAASGLASSAAARSSGMVAVRCDSYASAQRPSANAASTSARPAGCMSPEAMSASAFPQLILDGVQPR
jgi:hypothetical protein